MPDNTFLGSLGPTEYFALALAAVLTLVFAAALHVRHGPRLVVLAAFLPPPLVALFSPQFDFVGWHGFMHASPMYQIMDRGLGVPEEPLFAGGELRYPWVEHWIFAKASALTGVNPLTLKLIAETFGYATFLAASAWLASKLTRDALTIALATLLSGFGISIFHSGLFAEPLARAFPPLWLESRVVPVDKFLNVTSSPLGFAAMAAAAAAGVELATTARWERRALGVLATSTLLGALIHPLSWLGILVYGSATVLVLLAVRRRAESIRAGLVALAVAVPSVLCIPYHRSVGASESSDGWVGLTPSWELLGAKLADAAFFLVTFVVLAYLHRTELLQRLRERDRSIWLVSIAIACFVTAYLSIRAPGRNEYKFLLELVPAAAAVMALALREGFRRHPVLAVLLLFMLLVPGGRILGSRPWFTVTDPARVEGRQHRALDPAADALYQWVARRTPKDAVFLAADLRMPPLGRRSLYVAVDAPWRGRDGWGLPRNSLLQWHVRRPDATMYRRQHLATVVLNPDWAFDPAQTMSAIRRDVPRRPVFVHAVPPAVIAKLEATPGFVKRFANSAGAVFGYRGD